MDRVRLGSITVEGPIAETDASRAQCYPSGLGPQLQALGYHQDEYIIGGSANVYGPSNAVSPPQGAEYQPATDCWRVILRPSVPFRTRILVRRPLDAERFSGTVHVEPLHNVREGAPNWGMSHRWMMRQGDIWIGITASSGSSIGKSLTVTGGVAWLKSLDATRYESLGLDDGPIEGWPVLSAQAGGGLGAKEIGEFLADIDWSRPHENHGLLLIVNEVARTYSQSPDIVNHIAALVRSTEGRALLGGREADRVYAAGASATGLYLQSFLASGHHTTVDGRALIDAYVPLVSRTRSDVNRLCDALVVTVLSEGEVLSLAGMDRPSPDDSDEPPYRHYELPGTGHNISAFAIGEPGFGWEVIHFDEGEPDPDDHEYPHHDKPQYPFFHGLWSNIERWIREGIPMPHAERITRDPRQPDGIARDRFGNALGGIRTPWIEAPDARYFARCPLHTNFGYFVPLVIPEGDPLHVNGHEWFRRFRSATQKLIEDGFVPAEDAPVYLDFAEPAVADHGTQQG